MSIKIAHVATVSEFIYFAVLHDLIHLSQKYIISAICSPGLWIRKVEAAGIPVMPISIARKSALLSDLATLARLVSYFRQQRFHLVHTHTPKGGFLGQLAAWLVGVPITINSVRGFYFTDYMSPWIRRFFMLMEKITARFADRVLFLSLGDMEFAIREGLCPEAKAVHIGSGIDLNRFNPSRLTASEIKAKKLELGIQDNGPVIGIVGRFVREKGFQEFFKAAKLIHQEYPDAKFITVGGNVRGDAGVISRKIMREMGLESCTVMLGHRMDMPELYAIMDILVLPSYREGVPRTLMEGAAMGKPIVATNIRGCREVVENGYNGILVPARQARPLAAAILDLLRDPDKAMRMGEAGRKRAIEQFDQHMLSARIAEEYDRLIKSHGLVNGESG